MKKQNEIKQCVRFKGDFGQPASKNELPGKELAEFVERRLRERNFEVQPVEDEEIWYTVKVKSGEIEYPLMVCQSTFNEEYWEISCPRTIGFFGRLFGKTEEAEIQNLTNALDEILRGEERITGIKWYGDFGELSNDYAEKKGERRLITVGNYFQKLFLPICAIGMGLAITGAFCDKVKFLLKLGGIIFLLPFIAFFAMLAINIFWGLFSDIKESFQKKKKKKWLSWFFGVFLLSLFIGPLILGLIKNPAVERVMPVIIEYVFRLGTLAFFVVIVLIFGGLLVRSFSKIFIPRYRKNKISKELLMLIGSFLTLTGFTGFLSGVISSLGMLGWTGQSIEFPLADIWSIANDRDGNLFVLARFYSRIQEYDSSGKFVRGWPFYAPGGGVAMRINDENKVVVAASGMGKIDVFDMEGNLLESRKHDKGDTNFWDSFEENGKHIFNETTGQEYTVEGWIFTKVIQSGPEGEKRIGPKGWYLFPFQGPFQAVAMGMFGMVLMNWAEKKKKGAEGERKK